MYFAFEQFLITDKCCAKKSISGAFIVYISNSLWGLMHP